MADNRITESSLGLTTEDLEELKVNEGIETSTESVEDKGKRKKEKKTTYILSDKQFNKFAWIIWGIMLCCIAVINIFKPNMNIVIEDMSQYMDLIITLIFSTIFRLAWLPCIFELFVILFKKSIGTFYRTWTYVTFCYLLSMIAGLIKIYML